mgnify:CR=1 FL=1
MGHSSGGYMIPAARAHLHFEVGLAITSDFQGWYDHRRFGSRNEHGMWNGMNLVGVDPVAFFGSATGFFVAADAREAPGRAAVALCFVAA